MTRVAVTYTVMQERDTVLELDIADDELDEVAIDAELGRRVPFASIDIKSWQVLDDDA